MAPTGQVLDAGPCLIRQYTYRIMHMRQNRLFRCHRTLTEELGLANPGHVHDVGEHAVVADQGGEFDEPFVSECGLSTGEDLV